MRLAFRLCRKMTDTSRTFLFWFSNEHANFSMPEFQALFRLFKLDMRIFARRKVAGPFIMMDFPNEVGPKKLMSRSVLAHSCYEVWGTGNSAEQLHQNVKDNFNMIQPYIDKSFRIRVETYGKTIKQRDKVQLIDTLSYLPLKGKVDLINPDLSLTFILYYGVEPNSVPLEPYELYFGRWITDGQRKLVSKTNLKERKFIGNTSMDPLLSLLMVNLAMVKDNDMVLDPFVGTGSILVAAAVMGSYVIGTDIDYLMLHGKTRSSRAFQKRRAEDENIRANLIQYGVENRYLDILVADASLPVWKEDFRLDAIVTDPPYGIRESTERIGFSKRKEEGFKIGEEYLDSHFPSKTSYTLCDIFCDLMNFAAERLEIDGRLVFWIPISRNDYQEDKLPTNSCLELISNHEQVLTSLASRRLLVFQKFKEPSASVSGKTEMDETALMYRFKLFENTQRKTQDSKQVRKNRAYATFGKACKRGQLYADVRDCPSLTNVTNGTI